jgi:uncharacterized protein YdeI (YjbR/CyaY-like superfamily)
LTDRLVLYIRSALQWLRWVEGNHDRGAVVWLRLLNKSSLRGTEAAGDLPLSYGEAVVIALCFGWIDCLARGHDEVSRIQRFSPRKPKSAWSKSNVERVQRLVDEGRMRAPGLRQVEAAKTDGRWPRPH